MAHNKPRAWTKGGPSAKGSLTDAMREWDTFYDGLSVNTDKANAALYNRFCSLARDVTFRGSVYGNAALRWRQTWGGR